jgi:large subunit ribosomal protein L18
MATKRSRRSMSILRHDRLRRNVEGSTERPRLAVFRSNRHMYAQVIDDSRGATLVAANTLQKDFQSQIEGKKPIEVAGLLGEMIATKAKAAGIGVVVFDRGGFKYHGQIKALADSARKAGLEF